MPKTKNTTLIKLLKWLFSIGFLGVVLALGGVFGLYLYLSPQLPPIDVLKDVRLQVPLRVYTSEGDLIVEIGEKRREPLSIDKVPEQLKAAYLAAEDDRFYSHPGVDYQGLLRAVVNLIKTGKKGQGGSTITMQVARNFFLTPEKSYKRKINEIFLALRIENELSKGKILELYLNKIFLGNRAYGVGAASKVYYGVEVQDLTLAQMAMLAALPKAPSATNPVANPEGALGRRNYVLDRMLHLNMIDEKAWQQARNAPISAKIHSAAQEVDAGYVGEMARAKLVELFADNPYTAGLKVYTTVKTAHQEAANRALRKALLDYEQRRGYRGAVDTLDAEVLADAERIELALKAYPTPGGLRPAVVTVLAEQQADLFVQGRESAQIHFEDLKWAGKRQRRGKGAAPKVIGDVLAVGDVVYLADDQGQLKLAQMPLVEGAFVSLDPSDGAIQALVGGFDFYRSKFNRVMQAERQPGSNFKPIIYSAALEKGYTAARTINDAPVVLDDVSLEGEWRPENYSGKFFGPTRFREALVRSRNLVSIRLLDDMGLDYVMDYVTRFGIDPGNLPRNLSLALGSGGLKPIQVVRAYATFANQGFLVEPYLIDRIEDVDGTVLFKANPAIVCDGDCPKSHQQAGQSETTVDKPDASDPVASEPDPVKTDESGNLQKAGEAAVVNYAERVLDPRNAYIMRSIMRDVVRRGTARRATVLGRRDIGGKTGTTNDQHDAWYSGFNDQLVATAWVGYDQQKSLGARETGGRAALPIWIDYMREALQGLPENKIIEPDGMTSVLIDPVTGDVADGGNSDAIFEMFRVEYAPTPSVSGSGDSAVTTQEIKQQEETTEGLF